jgi:hypothetical protein
VFIFPHRHRRGLDIFDGFDEEVRRQRAREMDFLAEVVAKLNAEADCDMPSQRPMSQREMELRAELKALQEKAQQVAAEIAAEVDKNSPRQGFFGGRQQFGHVGEVVKNGDGTTSQANPRQGTKPAAPLYESDIPRIAQALADEIERRAEKRELS